MTRGKEETALCGQERQERVDHTEYIAGILHRKCKFCCLFRLCELF